MLDQRIFLGEPTQIGEEAVEIPEEEPPKNFDEKEKFKIYIRYLIIIAIIGAIGGIDLIRLLFVKEDKRGKNADALNKEVEAKEKELDIVNKACHMLSEQLEKANATIVEKDARITDLEKERAILLSTQSCLFDDMCIHKGCRIRKPHQGQGSRWYEEYRNDPALGADYFSIDTLMKQDRIRRKKIEEGEDESED